MGYVAEFMIGSTIGIILYILIISISQTLTSTLEFNDKTQKIFIIKFLSALCLLCLAFTSFSYRGKLENRTVKWGLILSGAALSINTMIINWNILSDNTKIILIGLCLSVIVWYAYQLESKDSDGNKDNNEKYNDKEDEGDEEDEEDEENGEREMNDEYDIEYEENKNNSIYKRKRGKKAELNNKFEEFLYNDNVRYPTNVNNVNNGYGGNIPAIDPQIFMRY
jgi:hypothetical protein